eukprot:EG_transcript_11898
MCPRISERKTLFCVRHAEAVHNRQELIVEQEAESPEEAAAARERILEDPRYRDAPLTSFGLEQTEESKKTLHAVLEHTSCPSPTLILVSPLTRTLQTALRLFPHHNNIQALELLRERRTGRPCDERRHAKILRNTPALGRVNFDDVVARDRQSTDGFIFSAELLELEKDLEDRVRCFLDYVKTLDHSCIAIVTHKAFLRALQRVTACKVEQFGNAEARIHDLVWGASGLVVRVQKVRDLRAHLPVVECKADKWCSMAQADGEIRYAAASSNHSNPMRAVQEAWAVVLDKLSRKRPTAVVVYGAAHYDRRQVVAALKYHCGNVRCVLMDNTMKGPAKLGEPREWALTLVGINDPSSVGKRKADEAHHGVERCSTAAAFLKRHWDLSRVEAELVL